MEGCANIYRGRNSNRRDQMKRGSLCNCCFYFIHPSVFSFPFFHPHTVAIRCLPTFFPLLSTFSPTWANYHYLPPLLFPPRLLSSRDYQLPVPCSPVLPDLNFLHRTNSSGCLNMFPQNAYSFLSGLLKCITTFFRLQMCLSASDLGTAVGHNCGSRGACYSQLQGGHGSGVRYPGFQIE